MYFMLFRSCNFFCVLLPSLSPSHSLTAGWLTGSFRLQCNIFFSGCVHVAAAVIRIYPSNIYIAQNKLLFNLLQLFRSGAHFFVCTAMHSGSNWWWFLIYFSWLWLQAVCRMSYVSCKWGLSYNQTLVNSNCPSFLLLTQFLPPVILQFYKCMSISLTNDNSRLFLNHLIANMKITFSDISSHHMRTRALLFFIIDGRWRVIKIIIV